MYVVAVQFKSQFAVEREGGRGAEEKVGRGYLGRLRWGISRHLML